MASPLAQGLFSAGYSMSGSPRLNSTTQEAQLYWHRQVVTRTRCAVIGFTPEKEPDLRNCMYSLNASELLDSIPPNWSSDGWSFNLFNPSWQYAPLLLIDGRTLPAGYISTFNRSLDVPNPGVPVVIGITRQESDFSPGKDVRNMSAAQFTAFVQSKFGPFYSKSFVDELISLYVPTHEQLFLPQKVYSEIITDASTLCASLHLADAISSGKSRRVYLYAASQTMQTPPGFCALQQFNHFSPPYCPQFSFHAVDMFALMQPFYDSNRFNYHFNSRDRQFGALVKSRLIELSATGYIQAWPNFSPEREYAGVDLKVPEKIVPHFQRSRCSFWLRHGFYDKIGLIN